MSFFDSPTSRENFHRAPQIFVTSKEKLQEYTTNPRWLPVKNYPGFCQPEYNERGMLVELSRVGIVNKVIERVFAP